MVKSRKLKLKPSARDKRRYFLVRASREDVEKVILEYIGVLGFARSAFMIVSPEEGKNSKKISNSFLIGSCLVSSLDDIRASLGLAGIEILKVSGTLKGLSSK